MIRTVSMSRIEGRMPELSARIVGGLGVLLLSPTVLTAASRSRLTDCGPAGPPVRSSAGSAKARGDVRMRIAVTASGLAAATSLAYTAPGTPWARADVLSAPTTSGATTGASDATGDDLATGMGHESKKTYSGVVPTVDGTRLVDAVPAAVGVNTVAITVLDAKGAPTTVDQWSATASLPGEADIAVPLKGFGQGVAAADVSLPAPGKWTFTVTVRVVGAEPTSFTHDIPITLLP
jgi:hypothetical protein